MLLLIPLPKCRFVTFQRKEIWLKLGEFEGSDKYSHSDQFKRSPDKDLHSRPHPSTTFAALLDHTDVSNDIGGNGMTAQSKMMHIANWCATEQAEAKKEKEQTEEDRQAAAAIIE